jgi:hypothetical protein
MRRVILIALAAATIAATGWAASWALDADPAHPTPAAHQPTGQNAAATSDGRMLATGSPGPAWPPPGTPPTWTPPRPTATRSSPA